MKQTTHIFSKRITVLTKNQPFMMMSTTSTNNDNMDLVNLFNEVPGDNDRRGVMTRVQYSIASAPSSSFAFFQANTGEVLPEPTPIHPECMVRVHSLPRQKTHDHDHCSSSFSTSTQEDRAFLASLRDLLWPPCSNSDGLYNSNSTNSTSHKSIDLQNQYCHGNNYISSSLGACSSKLSLLSSSQQHSSTHSSNRNSNSNNLSNMIFDVQNQGFAFPAMPRTLADMNQWNSGGAQHDGFPNINMNHSQLEELLYHTRSISGAASSSKNQHHEYDMMIISDDKETVNHEGSSSRSICNANSTTPYSSCNDLKSASDATTSSTTTTASTSASELSTYYGSAATTAAAMFRSNQLEQWSQRYHEMAEFRDKFGHCLVPLQWPSNPSLAHWVKRQRHQYRMKQQGNHSTLTPDREAALEKLGFVWDSHAAMWEERWKELAEYRQQHGHCRIPKKYPANPQLSVWVKCQRRQFKLYTSSSTRGKPKDSNMTPERIQKLASLGFDFTPRPEKIQRLPF